MAEKSKEGQNQDAEFEFEETDEEGVAQNVSSKLKKLREELKACQKERGEYLEGWQRAKADLINDRKESDKRFLEARVRAQIDVLESFLPVLDSFDMAFANQEAWEKVDKNWRAGIEHIYANFLSVLADYGILPFDGVGGVFDPLKHESVETVEVKQQDEDNTIYEVLQRGYKQGDVILRPAKVKVAVYKES